MTVHACIALYVENWPTWVALLLRGYQCLCQYNKPFLQRHKYVEWRYFANNDNKMEHSKWWLDHVWKCTVLLRQLMLNVHVMHTKDIPDLVIPGRMCSCTIFRYLKFPGLSSESCNTVLVRLFSDLLIIYVVPGIWLRQVVKIKTSEFSTLQQVLINH